MKYISTIAALSLALIVPSRAAAEAADVLEIGNFNTARTKEAEKINLPKWTPKDAPASEPDDEIKKLTALLHGQSTADDKDANTQGGATTTLPPTPTPNNNGDKIPKVSNSPENTPIETTKDDKRPDLNAITNAYDAIAQRLADFKKRHGVEEDHHINQFFNQLDQEKSNVDSSPNNVKDKHHDKKSDSNRSLLEASAASTSGPAADGQKFESVLQSLGLNLGRYRPNPSTSEKLRANETRALKEYLTQIMTFAAKRDLLGVYSNLKLAIDAFANKQLPEEPPSIDLTALPVVEAVGESASLDGRFQSLVKTSIGHGPSGTDATTDKKIEPIHQLSTAAVTPDGKSIPTPSVTDGKTTVIEVPNSVLESPEAAIVTIGSNASPKFPPKESFGTPNAASNASQNPNNGEEEVIEVRCGDRIIKLNCARDDAATRVVDEVVKVLDGFNKVKQGVKDITKEVEVVNAEIEGVSQRAQEEADRAKRQRRKKRRHRKWLAQMKKLKRMQKDKELEEGEKGEKSDKEKEEDKSEDDKAKESEGSKSEPRVETDAGNTEE